MRRRTFLFTAVFALVLSIAALGIGAAVDTPSTLMSRGDYLKARRAIEADARLAIGACRAIQGHARELCKVRARATERVRVADLQARYHGTVAAAQEARIARVRADYDIEKARCGDRAGDERTACLRAARAHRTQAVEAARLAAT